MAGHKKARVATAEATEAAETAIVSDTQSINITEYGEDMAQLSVKERLLLLGLLPAQGNIFTMRTVAALREALCLSDDERVRFGVQESEGRITWENTEQVEIEMSGVGKALIVEGLQQANAGSRLTLDHVSLWEKFAE